MHTTALQTSELNLHSGRSVLNVLPEKIIRLEALSNYTYVYLEGHAPILMAKVLHLYDDILRPHGFIRTHKSHLINPRFVSELDPKGKILMQDTSMVAVSRRKKRAVFTTISNL